MAVRSLDDPFYYLNNFQQVLAWLTQRYADVLSTDEQRFIEHFAALPRGAQGLLVRMVMRKGLRFRHSKLHYPEIGDIGAAVAPLLALGWVEKEAPIGLAELFEVLLKPEILLCLGHLIEQPKAKKTEWLQALDERLNQSQPFRAWCPQLDDRLYSLTIMNLCDRLRLMFFGNLYQDWSEFVLSDLGIFTYETVEFSAESRGLRSREDVDACLFLHDCQQRFEAGESLEEIVAQVNELSLDNPWLERRRGKLLFQIGQHGERIGDFALALGIYRDCAYPGARLRMVRVLERIGEYALALELGEAAMQAPQSAAETQALLRIVPRLRRKLGGPPVPRGLAREMERLELQLPRVDPTLSVEYHVQAHLHDETAPVHYVENSLINSLFGLLCWPAIFAPLPGAFSTRSNAGRWTCSTKISMPVAPSCSQLAWQSWTMAAIGRPSAVAMPKSGACSRLSYSGARCPSPCWSKPSIACRPRISSTGLTVCCWTSRPIAPACRT